MKIRVTLMTENDKHLDMPKKNIEANAEIAWNLVCTMLNTLNPEEKASIEKCELIEI